MPGKTNQTREDGVAKVTPFFLKYICCLLFMSTLATK
jgi:hypothetical protein